MRRAWRSLLLCAGLAACVEAPGLESALKPRLRPEPPLTAPAPPARAASAKSEALRAAFTQIQSAQLTLGLLRRDGGGPDTPFTSDMLARNFTEIVFFNEYAGTGPSGVLRRWETGVVLGLEFGASVPPAQRARDEQDVTRYANRLARLTGHPVGLGARPNFIVAFASEDDRSETLERVAARLAGIGPKDLARLDVLQDDIYCLVLAFPTPDNPSAYGAAIALIRAENPDLLRLSCIHEELAQGLGLANDSPEARPSIFNDDDEFALLTSHDELLLSILYDPMLRTGQSLEEARPLVQALARNRLGEEDTS